MAWAITIQFFKGAQLPALLLPHNRNMIVQQECGIPRRSAWFWPIRASVLVQLRLAILRRSGELSELGVYRVLPRTIFPWKSRITNMRSNRAVSTICNRTPSSGQAADSKARTEIFMALKSRTQFGRLHAYRLREPLRWKHPAFE